MVLVTTEASVPEQQWSNLQRAFAHAMKHPPDGIVSSLLAQDSHDASLWRICTLWVSHEAATQQYDAGARMPSIYAFHLVGLVPEMSISDVVYQMDVVTQIDRVNQI